MKTEEQTYSTFQSISIDQAAQKLHLSKEILTLIKTPDRELHVELPIVDDNGDLEVYLGYRVQHNNSRGPYKGGVSFQDNLTPKQVRSMAALYTCKAALTDIPFGGSYGGVSCNLKKFSSSELERLTRLYTDKIDCIIGPQIDIPGIGLGTNEQVISWILDEYSKKHGFQPACVTGKPTSLLGSYLGKEAGGYGLSILHKEALKHWELTDINQFILHGFGKIGRNVANYLYKEGANFIAISDSNCTLFNKDGFNIPKLIQHKELMGTLSGFTEATELTKEEFFGLECDALIMASTPEQLTKDNALEIKAKIILEGADSSISFEAETLLLSKDIKIVPDILACSGENVLSYFEWVQNLQHFRWDEKSIKTEIAKILATSFNQVAELSNELNCSLRLASYMIAVDRLAQATKLRGYQ